MENGNPPGAPEQTGESTSKSRGDAILAELEANMGKFASIATSVKDMSASIASLRTDINELKRKRTPEQDSDDKDLLKKRINPTNQKKWTHPMTMTNLTMNWKNSCQINNQKLKKTISGKT
ncbi:hypothetical protein DPMN_123870 [Dreissena polymorpha]|uniref:Uncharacterized protein n=1 Tax=Dreissena polymorpha TaxID=45954 RepID=A0A9D4GRQ3_DREPO|nr:hypothetical protein DPMN_123870 [Dreissena polymorpha]